MPFPSDVGLYRDGDEECENQDQAEQIEIQHTKIDQWTTELSTVAGSLTGN